MISVFRRFHTVAPHVLRYLEAVAIFAGVWALFATLEQTRIAKDEAIDQQIIGAWQLLAIPGGGSTGKSYALETLIRNGASIVGLDLSCAANGSMSLRSGRLYCATPAELNRTHLRGKPGRGDKLPSEPDLIQVDFSDASLSRSTFADVSLFGVDMRRAVLHDTTFERSQLTGVSFVGAETSRLKFIASNLQALSFANTDLIEVDFIANEYNDINISGAVLCHIAKRNAVAIPLRCNKTIDQAFLDGAFFDPANPPRYLRFLDPHLTFDFCKPKVWPTKGRPCGPTSVKDIFPSSRQVPPK